MDILYASILIVVAIVISFFNKIESEKDLVVAGIRAAIQLIAVGYVLHIVFKQNNLLFQLLLLSVMALIAAYTAKKRVKEVKNSFFLSLAGIVSGTIVSLGILLVTKVVTTEPRYLIPLGGMIIGNTMTATALVLDRYASELKNNFKKIEFMLALGFSAKQAGNKYLTKSVKAAMTPVINTMKIVGIIQLPGAMTGMLMAGATPVEAAKYQLIVIYMLASAVSVSTTVTIILARKYFFAGDIRMEV